MIRIVLADDHSVVRMGFRMIIEQQMDLQWWARRPIRRRRLASS